MAFDFGGISSSVKMKEVGKYKAIDPIVINHLIKGQPYYIILLNILPDARQKKLLKSDLDNRGIYSYIVMVVVNVEYNPEKLKSGLVNFMETYKSPWKDYLNYEGQHCSGILAFGPALYAVIKTASDINITDFYASDFTRSYIYLGHGYCGDYDTYVVPADKIEDVYPYNEVNPAIYKTWRTRFFLKQLKVLKDSNKWMPDLTEPILKVLKTEEECSQVLKEHMNSPAVAFDTETTGLDTYLDKVGCLTITWDGITGYYMPWDKVNKRLLVFNLQSCKKRITQNGKYDLKIMWNNGMTPYTGYPTDDTMQLSHAINSDRSRGLKAQAFYNTFMGGYDGVLDLFKKKTKVSNYCAIPVDILSKYAILDAIVTFRSYFVMMDLLEEIDRKFPNDKLPDWPLKRWYEQVMMPVYSDFIDMEFRGTCIDLDAQRAAQRYYEEKAADLRKQMAAAWGVKPSFKFESTKELGKLFQSLGWPAVELAKDGSYKTSDSVLNEYIRQGRPGIELLQKYRSIKVFINTFVGKGIDSLEFEETEDTPFGDGLLTDMKKEKPETVRDDDDFEDDRGWNAYIRNLPDGQARMFQSYLVNGTTSYRNIGKNPNLQQVPVHDPDAKPILRVLSVPWLEEYTIETDDGRVFKGVADDFLDTNQGKLRFDQIQEDTVIKDYWKEV